MKTSLCTSLASLLVATALAQGSSSATVSASATTSSYSETAVPTGKPIPGNYTGPLRPQIHFSPPKGFMNDPNGMFVDANGTWHLYYQYNPTDIVAGNQHWGHATTRDLYHWENQQIAIYPGAPDEGIFSGSAVIDLNNTSGMFPNQTNGVVAIYTLNTPQEETQNIAFSYDGGYTFEKYSGNPVISINSTQFRDPQVIYHKETSKWVMVVAYAQEFTIGIFTSTNLLKWEHSSNFTHHGLLGLQYECPNMVSIPMEGSEELMYLLAISINPGAPMGGSITQYFPGSFNGSHFTAVDSVARIADFGKDNYAAQWFYGTPDGQNPVSIGWASNWQYCNDVPTGAEGWRSAMSLPRVNYLKNVTGAGFDLVSTPYDLTPVLDSLLESNDDFGNGSLSVPFANVTSGALYFAANVSGIPTDGTATGIVNFTISASKTNESLSGGFYIGGGDFWLNRGKAGKFGNDNPFFTDKFSTNIPVSTNGTWSLEGTVDRSILEVFLEGGERSATLSFFPEAALDTFVFTTADINTNATISVKVWSLKSAWAAQQGSDGLVSGNVAMS